MNPITTYLVDNMIAIYFFYGLAFYTLGLALWLASLLLVYLSQRPTFIEMFGLADVLGRYLLGIPGALLAAGALMAQQRTFREHQMPQFGRDLVWCATALLLYGAIGQLFVRQTAIFPSTLINSTLFLDGFGIPVQLFRAFMAAILAFFMLRALNAFELENLQRLEAANKAQLAAQAAMMRSEREASREILHQVVMAQEAERQRIARELHDATGQSLTAIALGLHGINKLLGERVPELGSQIQELEDYGTSAFYETALFRIAQEALTVHEDEQYFFEMLAAGASGYVPKRAAPDDLVSAIRTVSQGQVFLYPSLAKLLVKDFLQRADERYALEKGIITLS